MKKKISPSENNSFVGLSLKNTSHLVPEALVDSKDTKSSGGTPPRSPTHQPLFTDEDQNSTVRSSSLLSFRFFKEDEDHNLAHNRAQYEAMRAALRESMEKPIVQDKELQAAIDELYRPTASPIGSGSTAAAIRYELSTGNKVKGKLHSDKGVERLRYFNRWLRNHSTAAPGDRAAAENIIHDLNGALGYNQRLNPQYS